MTKFSTAQTQLLCGAASSDDGITDRRGVATLIKRGLLISRSTDGGDNRLLITEAGRATLPQAQSPPGPAPKGKIGIVVSLLQRPQGAALGDLMAATGWQAHSVRGAISGSLKKGLGLSVVSEKTDAGRVYRICGEAAH